MAASWDLVLTEFNTLCTKAEGRDKLARLFQYAARTFVGLSAMKVPKSGTTLFKAEAHARTVMVQLAGARRTFRWCKEFPVLQSLPKSLQIKDPVDMVLDLLQKVSLVAFFLLDHVGQLKQWKILTGGKRSGTGTIQLGLKLFCLSNVMAVLAQSKKLFAQSKTDSDSPEKASERRKTMQALLRALLLVLQTAHMSLLYQTHDALVGFAGVITSAMDVQAQWPERKRAAPAAAAQGKAA